MRGLTGEFAFPAGRDCISGDYYENQFSPNVWSSRVSSGVVPSVYAWKF